MSKKIFLSATVVIVVLAAFFVFKGIGSSTADANPKVRIANLPITEGLPLYIAIEKGYFKDAGLDIEYIRFDAPNQIIDAVMSDQVDIVSPSGAMGISAVADSKNPGKLKIYAASGGTKAFPLNGLFVGNDSSIKSIEDLKGKKLGILPGIQWRTIATEILSQHGLNAGTDVLLVELAPGLHATALASKEIDTVLTLEPGPTIIREKKLGTELAPTPTQNIADPFFAGAGIINTNFLNKHPDAARKVLEVLSRANAELRENPDASRQYLKNYTALTDDLISKVNLPVIKMWNEITSEDIKAIKDFHSIFYKHNVVDKPLDIEALLYKE